jgi:hypothetical protein
MDTGGTCTIGTPSASSGDVGIVGVIPAEYYNTSINSFYPYFFASANSSGPVSNFSVSYTLKDPSSGSLIVLTNAYSGTSTETYVDTGLFSNYVVNNPSPPNGECSVSYNYEDTTPLFSSTHFNGVLITVCPDMNSGTYTYVIGNVNDEIPPYSVSAFVYP